MATIEQGRMLDLIGQLKVATVVVGLVDVGLVSASYVHDSSAEEYFLAIVCLAFMLSLLFVILILLSLIPITDVWKKIDMVFHGVIAVLLMVGVLVQLIQVIHHRELSGGKVATRVFALIFGVMNTGTYSYIAITIFRTPNVT
ncbi:unnamed protein product [Allacma fusca]|uniref:MARVEL domain-containing protein n=1 Tax=Allacma fusca TaxID=39272 RepID=A0A8J2LNE0_9HEXA|nr:unnamed protein product [Allacma fusca]